jgi:hypothetical protein
MPFDAAPVVRSPLPDNIAGQSAIVLDMVEFYFRHGAQWTQGFESGIGARHCMLSAITFVRRELGDHKDRAPEYLLRAIDLMYPRWQENVGKLFLPLRAGPTSTDVITNFNDARGRKYSEIADVLHTAKEMAAADAWGLESVCNANDRAPRGRGLLSAAARF